MAIEITKRGTPATEVKHELRCRWCTTEFTFLASDAVMEHDMRDGSFFRVNCPVCGSAITKSVR